MRKRDWDRLFSEYDLRGVLDGQLKKVSDEVLRISPDRFQTDSDELLAADVASRLVVSPLEIHEEEISVGTSDVKVDVSHDPDRVILDRSRPFYLDGIEVTYHVPISGDAALLRCRPNSFTLNPPRAVIGKGELQFPYDRADRDVVATKKQFSEDLQGLKQWLPRVNQQVSDYNASLESHARQTVAKRRVDLSKTKEDIASLGFKVRNAHEPSVPTASPQSAEVRRKQAREIAKRMYDVALSFAGEDREYVEGVAEALKTLGITVFYDRFEQVELWGKDLAEHLGEVYGKNSRFVVLFISRAYAAKAWPNHEKQFALGRSLSGDKGRVLPVRFDNTEIAGLSPTVAYLDLRVLTPDKLAELIRQKIDSGEQDT